MQDMNEGETDSKTNIKSDDNEEMHFNYISTNNFVNCTSTVKNEILDPLESCQEDAENIKKEDAPSEDEIREIEELPTYKEQNFEINKNLNFDSTPNESAVGRKRRSRRMVRNKTLVRPYHCELCPMAFNRSQHLKGHMRTHLDESYKCDICGKCYSRKSNLKAHKFVHSCDKPYPCESCGKSFAQKVALEYHMRIHTGERPYPCKVCNKAFRSAPHLEVHRRTHTEERPYGCEECGKRFKMSAHLVAHKRIHTGEKPYVCEICNKAVGHLQSYKNHMNLHKNKKGHTCIVCEKTFVSTRDLASHSQHHISSKIGNLFRCERCLIYFLNELDLKLHLEIHLNTKSELRTCHCGEVFASEWQLDNHQKVHLGETPYTCDICKESFSQDVLLIEHLKKHEDEDKKPIICKFCGKAFSSTSELNEHICVT